MIERDEVVATLRDGNRGLQVSSDARSQHIDSMEQLLSSFESADTADRKLSFLTGALLRNAAIFLLAFLFGVAGAAYSDRVPGDPLYRAKLAAEQPAQIVDRDLVANNRLGELELLIQRGAEPQIVLEARGSAAQALMNRQADHPMVRALSLLAWPGGLDGRGLDAVDANRGLLIAETDWTSAGGYSASLADGHLVTISALDGDAAVSTTGNWTGDHNRGRLAVGQQPHQPALPDRARGTGSPGCRRCHRARFGDSGRLRVIIGTGHRQQPDRQHQNEHRSRRLHRR